MTKADQPQMRGTTEQRTVETSSTVPSLTETMQAPFGPGDDISYDKSGQGGGPHRRYQVTGLNTSPRAASSLSISSASARQSGYSRTP